MTAKDSTINAMQSSSLMDFMMILLPVHDEDIATG
jgi:hypothetical protein